MAAATFLIMWKVHLDLIAAVQHLLAQLLVYTSLYHLHILLWHFLYPWAESEQLQQLLGQRVNNRVTLPCGTLLVKARNSVAMLSYWGGPLTSAATKLVVSLVTGASPYTNVTTMLNLKNSLANWAQTWQVGPLSRGVLHLSNPGWYCACAQLTFLYLRKHSVSWAWTWNIE